MKYQANFPANKLFKIHYYKNYGFAQFFSSFLGKITDASIISIPASVTKLSKYLTN